MRRPWVLEMAGSFLDEIRRGAAQRRFWAELASKHDGLHVGLNVEVRSPERLTLGARVTIDSGALLHCGGMAWSGGRGRIVIGDDCYIGPGCTLFGAGEISIGSKVLISPGVVMTSHGHTFDGKDRPICLQPSHFEPIVIADDVWIGSNATVLPGVHVGEGTVVAAGAVVRSNLPPWVLAGGVPAKVLRAR